MSGGGPASVPPPVAADVGIVAALDLEVGYLIDRLKNVRRYAGLSHTVVEGEHGGKLVVLLVGGVGRVAARRSAEILIDGHRPRWVVSAGFCGALDPALKRNDTVLPDAVLSPDGQTLTLGVKIAVPAEAGGPRVTSGRLVTVDGVAVTAVEKLALRDRFRADVVDMETWAVAEVCVERSLRLLGVRVVSDEATTNLPAEVIGLMDKSGGRLVGTALRAIWNRPSCFKDLLSLKSQAMEAADRLAEVTLALIALLPD